MLEHKYREVCEKHGYSNSLNVAITREENGNDVTGIEIKNQTLKKLVRRDPNKP